MSDEPTGTVAKTRESLKHSSDFLSPVNAIVFASITILDIAKPAMEKGASRLIAVVAALAVALLLYRLNEARRLASLDGVSLARAFFSRGANRFLLFVVPFAVGMAWVGSAMAFPRGVVADAIPWTRSAQDVLFNIGQDVGEMKGDVKAIKKALNPEDPVGRLDKMGYRLDDESKARAIESCALDALALYVQAGERFPEAVPALGARAGSVLEKPIARRDPKLPEALKILAGQGMRFDARYPLTFTQAQTGAIPQFAGLVQSVPPANRLGFLPSYVKASPLAVAVWFDNAEAAQTLLALGADPNIGVDALLPTLAGGGAVAMEPRQISSAAKEARRLGRPLSIAK